MLPLYEQLLSKAPVVVLDTETTGLFAGLGNRVVEVGAVRFEGWREVQQISQLVDPKRRMEAKSSEICGIVDSDLVGMPLFADVADELLALVDGALIVAHNAVFDASFIGTELWLAKKYDLSRPNDPILNNPWLCTLKLARQFFHFGRNHLSSVAGELGVHIGQAHRALNDVYMTAEVLKRMARHLEKSGILTVEDFLHAQGDPIFTSTPPVVRMPKTIADAIEQRQDLTILYINEEQTIREITPLYAHQHYGQSYLIAYCHLRQDQRCFRLDRIFSAEPAVRDTTPLNN